MDLSLVFDAIEAGKLFHLMKNEDFSNRTVLHIKRHNTVFRFIKRKKEDDAYEYTILKENAKANFGTVREIWKDYEEYILGKS